MLPMIAVMAFAIEGTLASPAMAAAGEVCVMSGADYGACLPRCVALITDILAHTHAIACIMAAGSAPSITSLPSLRGGLTG